MRSALYPPRRALNRSLFAIGIDNTLPEEFARLYPRTVRTTRTALAGFESEYGVHLSDEESGLVAVILVLANAGKRPA